MANAAYPFGTTVNPAASRKLNEAMAEIMGNGGKIPGPTFKGYCADRGFDPASLRYRLAKAGIPVELDPACTNPGEGWKGEGLNPVTGTETPLLPGMVRLPDSQELKPIDDRNGQVKGGDGCRIPYLLTEQQQIRHDAEMAELVTDSIHAFRKGKAKGPNNRRIIPISKVSDLVALDTLFRRAARQGEGEGKGRRGGLVNIKFISGISRQAIVRHRNDETSIVLDVASEEVEDGAS